MPRPAGSWSANINGVETELKLGAIQADGSFRGSVQNESIEGWWDEVSQSVTFRAGEFVATGANTPEDATRFRGLYTGYLFGTPPTPAAGQDVEWTLAGSVVTTPPWPSTFAPGTARRRVFGWFAQLKQIV